MKRFQVTAGYDPMVKIERSDRSSSTYLGDCPSDQRLRRSQRRRTWLRRAVGVSLMVVVSSLTAFGFIGCAPQDDGTIRIAVIPKGTTHDFWRSVHAGALKAEREINGAGGPKIEVIWKGPEKEDDRALQIQVVQNFIAARVKGVVLAPLDDTALLSPVKDCGRAGIPVAIIDSGLQGEVGKDFVSYIATDNYRGGVLGGKRLGEVLNGEGKAILLRYAEGSASTMERERGFLETLAKEFPKIELLSSDLYGGATTESSQQKAQNLLTRFGDQVDGIFCPNESTTLGMMNALRDADLLGKVKFVGFDTSESLVGGVRSGNLQGLVLQNPLEMGYRGVMTMYDHLQGQPVVSQVDTGAVIVTGENMDDPKMKLLHSPDLAEWLGS